MAGFKNRSEGGQKLARALADRLSEDDRRDALILALPRGGVPVAYEVATALKLPLDVLIVRKLGAPGQPELAMGALASGGEPVLNERVIRALGLDYIAIERVVEQEIQELSRREREYRGDVPFPRVQNRPVIVVDDGLATGSTMRAAVLALRDRNAGRIIIAVPVAAKETCAELATEADLAVCLETPDPFDAVGFWFDDFTQTTDDEVRSLLQRARETLPESEPTLEPEPEPERARRPLPGGPEETPWP